MLTVPAASVLLHLDRRSWVTIAHLVPPDYRNSQTLAALEAEFTALAEEQGQRPVILSCTAPQDFDSSFISRLLRLRRLLLAQGSQLLLCELSPPLAQLFAQLHLDRYFPIFRDLRQALAELDG
jgi:anti-anti-sigma factor